MLYKEIIAIYCKIQHETHKLTLSAESRILSVKPEGTSRNHSPDPAVYYLNEVLLCVTSLFYCF
jgi:hypothetical protein